MQEMILLVVEGQEDETEKERRQPDVPGVVEALVGLDAAVGDLDGERDHVDDQVQHQQPKELRFCPPRVEQVPVDETLLDEVLELLPDHFFRRQGSELLLDFLQGQVSRRVFPPKLENPFPDLGVVEGLRQVGEEVDGRFVAVIWISRHFSLPLETPKQARDFSDDGEAQFSRFRCRFRVGVGGGDRVVDDVDLGVRVAAGAATVESVSRSAPEKMEERWSLYLWAKVARTLG